MMPSVSHGSFGGWASDSGIVRDVMAQEPISLDLDPNNQDTRPKISPDHPGSHLYSQSRTRISEIVTGRAGPESGEAKLPA